MIRLFRILYIAIEIGLYLHPNNLGAWHVVSEGSVKITVFPADCLHRTDCHFIRSTVGYSEFPAYSHVVHFLHDCLYVYLISQCTYLTIRSGKLLPDKEFRSGLIYNSFTDVKCSINSNLHIAMQMGLYLPQECFS